MDHDIVKVEGGYYCKVCQWTWKSKPGSDCPGVRRYEWQGAPENLKTKAQLKKLRLHPGQARGVVVLVSRGESIRLYAVGEALPWTEEEIAAEKERERLARRAARYRICKHCKKEVRRDHWDDYWEACNECRPGVISEHYRQRAIEEEEREEEHRQFLAENRDAAIVEARQWLELGERAVILDTETTGLDYDAEVVQVAVIGLDGTALLNALVRPRFPISEGAMQIHGITNEMVAGAPDFAEIYPKLWAAIEGKTVITYNAAFDRRMILQSGKAIEHMATLVVDDWVCAMELYAQYYGEWNSRHGSFRWQRLTGGDHSALGDCQATLELIRGMAAAHKSDCGCEICSGYQNETVEE